MNITTLILIGRALLDIVIPNGLLLAFVVIISIDHSVPQISKSELRTMCKRKVAAVFGSIMRHLDSMREQGKPMYIVLIPERIMEHPMLWKEETLQIKEKILRVSGDADPIFVKIPNILELGAIGFERLNNDDKYAIKYAIKTTKKMIKFAMPELKVKQVVRRLAEAKERSNPEYGYAIIRLGVKKKYQEF